VTKHPAGDPSATLAGATYELWDGDSRLATATTGADGTLRFPPVLPGRVYCLVEVGAPAGYLVDPSPACTDGPLTADVAIDLEDRKAPPPPAAAAPPPVPVPTSPAPAPAPVPPSQIPAPRPPVIPPTVARPELPRTGAATTNLVWAGLVTVLTGTAAVAAGCRQGP
jgi:LPXTG-motif cell wall-anchored protein